MHYVVGVICTPEENLHELLAPYDENLEVESYVVMTRKELLDAAKRYVQSYNEYPDDKEWARPYAECKTDEELLKLIQEDYDCDEEGNAVSTYNPDSKWDWYEIGGRWSNRLCLKDGRRADYAELKDISFADDDKLYYAAMAEWNREISSPYAENIRKEFKNAYEYAKAMCRFHLPQLLVDGVWHEDIDGHESFYDMFIKDRNQHDMLYIVDCHI